MWILIPILSTETGGFFYAFFQIKKNTAYKANIYHWLL